MLTPAEHFPRASPTFLVLFKRRCVYIIGPIRHRCSRNSPQFQIPKVYVDVPRTQPLAAHTGSLEPASEKVPVRIGEWDITDVGTRFPHPDVFIFIFIFIKPPVPESDQSMNTALLKSSLWALVGVALYISNNPPHKTAKNDKRPKKDGMKSVAQYTIPFNLVCDILQRCVLDDCIKTPGLGSFHVCCRHNDRTVLVVPAHNVLPNVLQSHRHRDPIPSVLLTHNAVLLPSPVLLPRARRPVHFLCHHPAKPQTRDRGAVPTRPTPVVLRSLWRLGWECSVALFGVWESGLPVLSLGLVDGGVPVHIYSCNES